MAGKLFSTTGNHSYQVLDPECEVWKKVLYFSFPKSSYLLPVFQRPIQTVHFNYFFLIIIYIYNYIVTIILFQYLLENSTNSNSQSYICILLEVHAEDKDHWFKSNHPFLNKLMFMWEQPLQKSMMNYRPSTVDNPNWNWLWQQSRDDIFPGRRYTWIFFNKIFRP